MLEIILMIVLCRKMGSILRDKGWEKTFWMQLLVVVIYLASMFAGSFTYGIYVVITEGEQAVENIGLLAYVAGYLGAILGVGTLFLSTLMIRDRRALPAAL